MAEDRLSPKVCCAHGAHAASTAQLNRQRPIPFNYLGEYAATSHRAAIQPAKAAAGHPPYRHYSPILMHKDSAHFAGVETCCARLTTRQSIPIHVAAKITASITLLVSE